MTTHRFSTPKSSARHVVCVKNDGYPASLEIRKIYQLLRDPAATAVKMVRIIDESGEDYLYPANFFVPIRLSEHLKNALSIAA